MITQSRPYWWLNKESQEVLNGGYLLPGEDAKQAITRIATAAANRLNRIDLIPRFIYIIEKGWLSLSSPIWANMGTKRGLPISCFNVTINDSVLSITKKLGEVIMQTKTGGGTSGYFSNLRGRGTKVSDNGKSSGSVSFMKLYDTAMDTISQGGVRRGAFAAYLDIDHPDFEEFLRIKSIGDPIQNLFFGACIPNYWMEEMEAGDVEKRKIWAKVLESRQQKGMPYLFFTDNVRENRPEIYKNTRSEVLSSNLCTEILLPSTESESFVCCLSSMNLVLYDEWKDTDAVKLAIYLLDGVMQEFIDKTEGLEFMEATNRFAKRHRALGLGVLGYHSYLQNNMIPFDSWDARTKNLEIFKHIESESKIASKRLAEEYEPAPIFEETAVTVKYRNTTTMAIAPTTSSSSILGQVSPGVEPINANYYKVGLSKGNFMRKNKALERILEERGKNTNEVWKEIMLRDGSVQHLDFLSPEEKEVFKTFREINQVAIINQAISRQRYIDQGQSINLNIPAEVPIKLVNKMLLDAYKGGITTLYYQRSQSVAKGTINDIVNCTACEA